MAKIKVQHTNPTLQYTVITPYTIVLFRNVAKYLSQAVPQDKPKVFNCLLSNY